jgi:two-component system response regulator TctD
MRLLLVEDSSRLRDLVGETVREAGWGFDAAPNLAFAEAALATTTYDLIVLDLGLPDGDGLGLLRGLRARKDMTPVLVLTARGAIDERIAGLDAGADDYLTKPFHNGELLARARALLRRTPLSSQPILAAGTIRFDPSCHQVSCAGDPVKLAPRERAVLEALMRNLGRVTLKRRLEDTLSQFGEEISPNAIELILSRLRRKLAGRVTNTTIETVRGVGYLLRETS